MSRKQRQNFVDPLASVIADIAKEGMMADVTIEVEGREFSCHRIILSTISPYFRAMFSSGVMDSNAKIMKLKNVDAKTFETFLDYVYNGKMNMTVDYVQELLKCSAIFQISPLQEHCESILADDVDTENCLTLFRIARVFNCKILLEKCRPYVMEGFNEFWKTEEFNTLDLDELESIVRDDDLVPVDEEQICDAVLQWVLADLEERKKHISRLFRYIRLVKICPEYLIEELYNNELLLNNTNCLRYLDEARNYHMLPARQQEFGTLRFHLRNSDEFEEVVLALTEYDMERSVPFYKEGKCLWAYSFQHQRWYTLQPIPLDHNPGNSFSIVTNGNDIYLSGGDATSKNMLKYDSLSNEWTPCDTTMKRGRYFHMMAAIRDSIYVIGGYNLRISSNKHVQGSIEEYSITLRRWKTVGELAIPVYNAAIVAAGEKIYILGGKQEDDKYCNAVQMFDTRHQEAKDVGKMPDALEQPLQTVTFDKNIYIFTTKGDIYELKLKPTIKFKAFKKLPQSCLPILGCTHYRGKLIILSSNTDKPEQFAKLFKLDLKQSPIKADLLTPKCNAGPKPIHACCRAIVNKQYMYHTYFQ